MILQLLNLQKGGRTTYMSRQKPSALVPTYENAEDPPAHPGVKDDEMLTTKEVARRLKVTPQTVQRLIHRRELKASRVGRDWRIKPSALEAFLEATEKH
jgi:excisionase family DNA binding protein